MAAGVEQEDACLSCATPYVRSCLTHECLPLVEFQLGEGITDAQVRDGRPKSRQQPLSWVLYSQ